MEFFLLMGCRVIVEKREMYRTVFECLLGQFYFVLSTELYLSACEGRFCFCFKYRTVFECLLGQFVFVCFLSTKLYLSAC